jgi:hypothetical protein
VVIGRFGSGLEREWIASVIDEAGKAGIAWTWSG